MIEKDQTAYCFRPNILSCTIQSFGVQIGTLFRFKENKLEKNLATSFFGFFLKCFPSGISRLSFVQIYMEMSGIANQMSDPKEQNTILNVQKNFQNFFFRFTAENAHFPSGELRLVCQAEIEGVWKTHVEGVALGGGSSRRRGGHNSGSGGTSGGANSHATSAQYNEDSRMEDGEYLDEEEYGWDQDVERSSPNHLLARNSAESKMIHNILSQIVLFGSTLLFV